MYGKRRINALLTCLWMTWEARGCRPIHDRQASTARTNSEPKPGF